jgi:hypothetical protein
MLQLRGQRRSPSSIACDATVSAEPHSACPPSHGFDSEGGMVQLLEVSSLVQRNKVVSKRKGAMAAATAAAGGVVIVAGAPIIGALGLAGAAYLAWDWFSFRVKNGMRF